MSTRVNVTIANKTAENIKCMEIPCASLNGLSEGDVIEVNSSHSYSSPSNDRIFVQFEGVETGTIFNLAMTCPEMSDNSASGFGNGGLQKYKSDGTPVSFTFNVGESDQANWGSGSDIDYGPKYADCS